MKRELNISKSHCFSLLNFTGILMWNTPIILRCCPVRCFQRTAILQLLQQSAIPPDSTAGNTSRLHGRLGSEQMWHHMNQLFHYSYMTIHISDPCPALKIKVQIKNHSQTCTHTKKSFEMLEFFSIHEDYLNYLHPNAIKTKLINDYIWNTYKGSHQRYLLAVFNLLARTGKYIISKWWQVMRVNMLVINIGTKVRSYKDKCVLNI